MATIRIPGSDRIIFVNDTIGDIVLDMNDFPEVSSTIANEDIRVVGNWSDYSGSGNIGPQEVMYQGSQNIPNTSLKGQIEQVDIGRTNRGRKSSTVRTRNKLVYIDLSK